MIDTGWMEEVLRLRHELAKAMALKDRITELEMELQDERALSWRLAEDMELLKERSLLNDLCNERLKAWELAEQLDYFRYTLQHIMGSGI
jgi:hypothetical protein